MYSHNKLESGSVFSIITDEADKDCVAYAQTSMSVKVYFCVIAFVSFDEKSTWSICRQVKAQHGLLSGFLNRVKVVHLSGSVRPVAAIHKCGDDSRF